MEEKHLPKLQNYEKQEDILNGRSSYSKTDEDATFMRTKDDHLGKGQLKPCYNIQLGTEEQFILNYTIHQTSSDMAVFTKHMDDTLALLKRYNMSLPKNLVADAGYGSEENYSYLDTNEIEAYVKYPGFYKEGRNKLKKPFDQRTLHYNEEKDYWVCPMGQHMIKTGETIQKTADGTSQIISHYKATNCQQCPLRGMCFKVEGNRELQVNHRARNFRKAARKRLESEEGKQKRRQRNIDVEPVFGHIKQDRHFRRFMLTSIDGVTIEMGLLAIAHNFTKWHLMRLKKGRPMPKSEQNNAPVPQNEGEKERKAA